MKKVCPRCGSDFVCSIDSIMDCHCMTVVLDAAQLKFIADNYEDCLCNGCLRSIQETIYPVEINPCKNSAAGSNQIV